MHDARVLKNSPIYQCIKNERNPLLLPEVHIIGDFPYPLMINLITSFRDTLISCSITIQYQTQFNLISN